jgi:Putative prokaryotic signal transducing protein
VHTPRLQYAPRVESEEHVVLTVVASGPEADIVCGLLRSAGIECGYRDTEAIDLSLEEFTAAGPREILVHPSDLDAARELLAVNSSSDS